MPNPMTMGACCVCAHPAADKIFQDIARDLAPETIIARYGLTSKRLERHKEVCMGPMTPETILAQAVDLQHAALRLLNKALADGDTKSALNALAAADRGLQTLGKLTGAFTDNPIVDARQQTINFSLGDLTIAELRSLSKLAPPE